MRRIKKKSPKYLRNNNLFITIFSIGVLIIFFIALKLQPPAPQSSNEFIYPKISFVTPTAKNFPTPIVCTLTNSESEKLAMQVMTNYLETFKNGQQGENSIITDYQIQCISNINITENTLSFGVIYSIKPTANSYLPIGTDNGVTTQDGWIINKSGSVEAQREGDSYTVGGIATGVGKE